MKKLIYITITLLSMWSCARFDDTKIWEEFKNYYERLEKVEAACTLMNSNISALQAIVTALQGNDYVTGVAEIVEDGEVVGYTITFSKSGVVKIYQGSDGADGADGAPGADGRPGADGAPGQDGADGKEGHSPVVGVRKDVDGIYYWTIDGEWMLDDEGQKVPATGKDGEDAEEGAGGKDGVTPLLKIEDGYWFVSYDEGANWTKLYKAVGENGADGAAGTPGTPGQDGKDGQPFFQGVDTTSSEDYIILTLADGTQIKLPTWKAFEELQTIVNKLNTNVSALQAIVEALENNDYVTEINPIIDNGKEIGYTILFAKSQSITIYHGKDGADGSDGAPGQNGEDGKDGKDGYTPVLGVKPADDDWSLDSNWNEDSESQTRYYWTLDGECLLDSNGNRIPANGVNGTEGANGSDGKNGITPKLKIEDGYWYISLDGGQTWQPEPLGPATAGTGGSIFSDISYNSDYLYITFANGDAITLSRYATKLYDLCTIEPAVIKGKTITISGHLDIEQSEMPYTKVSVYYSDSEYFNIHNAEKKDITYFDYKGNFSIELTGLNYATTYRYCLGLTTKNQTLYSSIYDFTTEENFTITTTYIERGYISAENGKSTGSSSPWYHTGFIAIEDLSDNDNNLCTSRLQGHSKVASIAYYASDDFDTFIACTQHAAGTSKQYSAQEIISSAPKGALYVVFSTHSNYSPLKITQTVYDVSNSPGDNLPDDQNSTLKIITSPAEAKVTFTSSESSSTDPNSIIVHNGTVVYWVVEAEGYVRRSGSYTVTENTALAIPLKKSESKNGTILSPNGNSKSYIVKNDGNVVHGGAHRNVEFIIPEGGGTLTIETNYSIPGEDQYEGAVMWALFSGEISSDTILTPVGPDAHTGVLSASINLADYPTACRLRVLISGTDTGACKVTYKQ